MLVLARSFWKPPYKMDRVAAKERDYNPTQAGLLSGVKLHGLLKRIIAMMVTQSAITPRSKKMARRSYTQYCAMRAQSAGASSHIPKHLGKHTTFGCNCRHLGKGHYLQYRVSN